MTQRLVLRTDFVMVSTSRGESETRVDDLALDSLFRQSLRRLQTMTHLVADSHDGGVRARALHVGHADGRGVIAIGHGLFRLLRVEQPVLDEHDRVVVANGGLEQSLGVGRATRVEDLQAGTCMNHASSDWPCVAPY